MRKLLYILESETTVSNITRLKPSVPSFARTLLILLLLLTTTTFATPLTSEEIKEAKQGKEYYDEILKKSKLSRDTKTLNRVNYL
ncbi:hypothetical protein GSY74_05310 [Sulfurovum sp. bin170]|uniref:hypothetical protein n=1 Tax=Sulfurovum sp. bin170 TaxID=2695268 RepID=UPI0013DFC3E0|nr:hypothetical protein [Sulfurovum sp. bin170]NEW60695.1 hypothetical protein [Sulfurovum sp. bin170]